MNRKYAIIGNADQYRIQGYFDTFDKAKFYGDAEFGLLGYRIIIL